MSAAPLSDEAPGRLRLRRVAFARLARIREEHIVPHRDAPAPAAREAEPADVVTETWRSIKAEVFRFAWALYYTMDTDPAKVLREAAERATKDDKSRWPTWTRAAKLRPELERLIREQPTKKRAALLARIAEDYGKKPETLRDILARAKQRRPIPFHYVHNPEGLLSAADEAEEGRLFISFDRIRPDEEPEKGELWRVFDGLSSPLDKSDEEAAKEKRRGTPPHTTHLQKSAASRTPEDRRRAHERQRTVTKHDGSGPLPRTRPRHVETMEDAGSESAPVLHQGVRESRALLARGAEGIPGREDAPAHRRPRLERSGVVADPAPPLDRRPRRPRGVKKRPPP